MIYGETSVDKGHDVVRITNVLVHEVMAILNLCHKYDVVEPIGPLGRSLIQFIDLTSAVELFVIADRCHVEDLKNACYSFFCRQRGNGALDKVENLKLLGKETLQQLTHGPSRKVATPNRRAGAGLAEPLLGSEGGVVGSVADDGDSVDGSSDICPYLDVFCEGLKKAIFFLVALSLSMVVIYAICFGIWYVFYHYSSTIFMVLEWMVFVGVCCFFIDMCCVDPGRPYYERRYS